MTFLNHVYQTIQKKHLLNTGDTILVGVSGGADSIALLEALLFCQGQWGLKIIAGHVHHGLRRSADADQKFVQKFCEQRRVLCETRRVHIPSQPHDSLEQAARTQRFAALIDMAKRHQANAIALAHHQDDLAETVLMRILRGTGLQGLQGILPQRDISGLRFIRPMIQTTREEIEDFLQKNGIAYRNDPTNRNTKFLRNQIRHQLIPLLKDHYNPQITRVLSTLAETASTDYDYLASTAEAMFHTLAVWETKKKFYMKTGSCHKLHPALLRMLLRHAIHALKGNTRSITFDHIQQIAALIDLTATDTTEIHLPHHLNVKKIRDKIIFQSMS